MAQRPHRSAKSVLTRLLPPVNFVSFASFLLHVYLDLHAVDIRFQS